MYEQRMRANLRPVIENHGVVLDQKRWPLQSVSWRHFWNVEKGLSTISIQKLEQIADEVGADMMDFFQL